MSRRDSSRSPRPTKADQRDQRLEDRAAFETPPPEGACYVKLDEIDRKDTRFQCRLLASSDDLLASISARGQHTPILLWRGHPPYTIIDGFRRVEAISSLGRDSVLATFEEATDETHAFARSFSENACRKNLTAYDKANAIWQATTRWKMQKSEVAGLLGLSVRQVDRYLRLLRFSEPIREALAGGHLTMAHALALSRASPAGLPGWIKEVESSELSADELAQRLKKRATRRGHTQYLIRDSKGFRLRPIRYRNNMSAAERHRIWDALESALKLIAQS